MTAALKIPVRMTVSEFLAWNPPGQELWQLVDGEPQAMPPDDRTHGAIQGELARIIGNHLSETGGRCSLVITPGVVPHVQADTNMRVPDLAVTCSDYENEEAALADPVLLIEVLSPSNQSETWADVWAYTTIPSVREILVARTAQMGAALLGREADGSWPKRPIDIEAGELILESIGLRVPLSAIYRTKRLAQRDLADKLRSEPG
jgi:Uma2 family endonuclease